MVPRVLLVGLLILGSVLQAAAQEAPRRVVPQGRLWITPIAGLRSPYVAGGREEVVVPGNVFPVVFDREPRRITGGAIGVEADLRVAGRLGITGGVLLTGGDPLLLTRQTPPGALGSVAISGPAVTVAKLGMSYRLPDVTRGGILPAGLLVASAARVERDYSGTLLGTGEDERQVSWGGILGYRALWPIGSSRVFLHTALEDMIVLWETEAEASRLESVLDLPGGTLVSADFDYDRTHVLMFTVGLTVRM